MAGGTISRTRFEPPNDVKGSLNSLNATWTAPSPGILTILLQPEASGAQFALSDTTLGGYVLGIECPSGASKWSSASIPVVAGRTYKSGLYTGISVFRAYFYPLV